MHPSNDGHSPQYMEALPAERRSRRRVNVDASDARLHLGDAWAYLPQCLSRMHPALVQVRGHHEHRHRRMEYRHLLALKNQFH
jgi:hypothetical protein